MLDFQNDYEPRTLALRTDGTSDEPQHLIGYCPRYLLDDMDVLLPRSLPDSTDLRVTVVRVNPPPAPVQLRELCELRATWPDGSEPFQADAFRSIDDCTSARARSVARNGDNDLTPADTV